MNGFSYIDIFDTKGIEYLIVISFLILIIPFWRALNKPVSIKVGIPEAVGILSGNILNIPQGLFFSKYHTWTHLERSGNARVGIDDLLLHLTGKVELVNLMAPGDRINKGEPVAELRQGGRSLKVASPVSGEIQTVNTLLDGLGALNEELCGKNWVCKIKPDKWIEETKDFYMGEAANNWSELELENFKEFAINWMNNQSPGVMDTIMQTGGELTDSPLSEMPDDAWVDFQKKFLSNIS